MDNLQKNTINNIDNSDIKILKIQNSLNETLGDTIKNSKLKEELIEHEIIQWLDPFNLDDFLRKLPTLNNKWDLDWIVSYISNKILASSNSLDELSKSDALAGLRDFGLIAWSLQKHWVEISSIGGYQELMLKLSKIWSESPRDTVYSYWPRNPSDDRLRTYTNTEEEKKFINSFNWAIQWLYWTIWWLLERHQNIDKWNYEEWLKNMKSCEAWFSEMISWILKTRKSISPEIFTNKLRPYFDPITINGVSYDAPWWAQMPLIIIDLLLWGSDVSSDLYRWFLDNNLKYCPQQLAWIWKEKLFEPSAITKLENMKNNQSDQIIRQQAKLIEKILNKILWFRMPHLKIAEANFNLRWKDEVWSWWYRPDILYHLITLTKQSKSRLNLLISN